MELAEQPCRGLDRWWGILGLVCHRAILLRAIAALGLELNFDPIGSVGEMLGKAGGRDAQPAASVGIRL